MRRISLGLPARDQRSPHTEGAARAGRPRGGLVEAISETTTGREAQSRFLFSATVELLEQYGFAQGRQVGKHAWVMSRDVDPA